MSPLFVLLLVAGGDADTRVVTLEDAMSAALEHNPSIHNISESISQAEVLVQKAWAILLPNLSAKGTVTRNNQEIVFELPDLTGGGGPGERVLIQELWGQQYGLTANITLFNARSIPLLKNAYDNIDRARDSGSQQRNDLLLAVASAFYQVNATQELVGVAEKSRDNAREFLRLSRARSQVGQATRIDVLRAEIQMKTAEKALAAARDSRTLARTALVHLTGLEEPFAVERRQRPEPAAGDLQALTDKALADRLDLKAARLSESIAQRDRIETWLKWVPTFDLTYDWTWNSAAGFAGDQSSWRLIFGARWDILQGGLRIAELNERESLARTAANNTEQLTLQINQEVERDYVELNQRQRNLAIAEEQEQLADENYRLVSKQYEVGLATSLDVLSASTQLSSARTNRVVESFQCDLAVLGLNKAVGELLLAGK